MKNRKRIVVAFLLVVALVLGVGYAALTDTLNIEGDMEVSHANAQNAFDEEVYFKSVSQGVGYTAEILSSNNDKANFTITGLEGADDKISITFTIANDNDFAVAVQMDPTNTAITNTPYFAYTLSEETFNIAANGTYDVTVTITLLQTPQLAEGQTISGTFSAEYDVTDIVS